jgi:hypothetical protein
VQTVADSFRQREKLTVAVEFDSLPRRVEYDPSILTALQMGFELVFQTFVQFSVHIVRNLAEHFAAPYVSTT